MKEEIERDLGEQPIAGVLRAGGWSAHNVVAASTEQITHKMIARACKGRRLTPNVQGKILRALNTLAQREHRPADLFNY